MRVLLFLLLVLPAYAARAQQLLGQVVDAATGRPIPYASIQVLPGPQGTTTNADGEFELRAVPPASRLVVAELGYRRDTVALGASGARLVVRLVPAAVQLPEVVLDSYAATLLAQAYRELRRTAGQYTYGQAFYRQITRLAGQATEVQEMVWATQTSNARVEGTALTQARYAKKKALLAFNNFSLYTKAVTFFDAHLDSTADQGIISLHAGQHYHLRVLGITETDGQQLVEIGFTNRDSTARTKQGSVIIEAASHQLLRLRLLTTGLHTKSNNPVFIFKREQTQLEWAFRPQPRGAAQLEYMKIDYRAALSRPLQRALPLQVTSFAYFYDGHPTPAPDVTYALARNGQTDLVAIKQLPYDADFWRQCSVVKRTPLEEEVVRAFEQQGAFGTLLTP